MSDLKKKIQEARERDKDSTEFVSDEEFRNDAEEARKESRSVTLKNDYKPDSVRSPIEPKE